MTNRSNIDVAGKLSPEKVSEIAALHSTALRGPAGSWDFAFAGYADLYGFAIALLAAASAQATREPLFWYRPCNDGLYEGPHHHKSKLGRMLREERPDQWKPLYDIPNLTQATGQDHIADLEALARHLDAGYTNVSPRMRKRHLGALRVVLSKSKEQ
jgi:hypothetical protein